MNSATTEVLQPDASGLARAAGLLVAGELVAFPTETVYGLGADARNGKAVAAIYAAKGRPSFNPLIVHVADTDAAGALVIWSDTAQTLADAHWPGPLTMVLPLRAGHGLSSLVTAGLDTVALRVPGHPVAQNLLRVFGGPVAAPSANPSGQISPTLAAHVIAGLRGRIAAVVDGGRCPVGLESTIVDLSGARPRLLRPGGVATEDIALDIDTVTDDTGKITAPGQLQSHYAPRAHLRLNAALPQTGELMLGFGPMQADLNLSPAGDLAEAAANLFEYLHKLDEAGQPIAVAPIPDVGLGRAINDRLRRAAAPRPASGVPGGR